MTRNELWGLAGRLSDLIDGHPIDVEMSREQIFQTMRARPQWNQQRWVNAVAAAARELIEGGEVDLVGPALEMRAEWIYQEGV